MKNDNSIKKVLLIKRQKQKNYKKENLNEIILFLNWEITNK